MSQTGFSYVDQTLGLVQTAWAPLVEEELRADNLWLSVLTQNNRNVEEVKGGAYLKYSYINKPSSTIRSIGTDADSYSANVLQTTQVTLQVNKRAVSAYKFEDLAVVLSQLEEADSPIRLALMEDVKTQINDHIKSLISPSTANTITGVSDFVLAQLSAVRTKAAVAKWPKSSPWLLALDPTYTSDLLDELSVSDASKIGDGISPLVMGQFVNRRMGFSIFEDNSLSTDIGYAFLPEFMLLAVGQPRFKISDLHPLGQFGYVISVDVPVGAKQVDDSKVISIAN